MFVYEGFVLIDSEFTNDTLYALLISKNRIHLYHLYLALYSFPNKILITKDLNLTICF